MKNKNSYYCVVYKRDETVLIRTSWSDWIKWRLVFPLLLYANIKFIYGEVIKQATELKANILLFYGVPKNTVLKHPAELIKMLQKLKMIFKHINDICDLPVHNLWDRIQHYAWYVLSTLLNAANGIISPL